MSDVKAELKSIRGIGDAKADAILEVLNETKNTPDSPMLAKAIEAAYNGNTHRAVTFLKRYAEE